MRPVISEVESVNGNCSITVQCPRRVIHHQKYDLKKYVVFAILNDGTKIELLTTNTSFTEEKAKLQVELPPQIDSTEGEVIVAALYGRDESLKVNSDPHKIRNWPIYGK